MEKLFIVSFFWNIFKVLKKVNKLKETYILKKSHYNIIKLFELLMFLLFSGHIFSSLFLIVGL